MCLPSADYAVQYLQERQHSGRRLQLDETPAHIRLAAESPMDGAALRAFRELLRRKAERIAVRAGYRANGRLSFSLGPQWNLFRFPIADGNFSVVFGALETDYAFRRLLSLFRRFFKVSTAIAQAARMRLPEASGRKWHCILEIHFVDRIR
jgi:hypothetical protein